MLIEYDMSILHHPCKVNVVADALSRMTMGSVSHIDEAKKDLVKDVHWLARVRVRFQYSLNGGFILHYNSESSSVFEVKYKQHLDKSLTELNVSVLEKHNEALYMVGMLF